MMTSTGTRRFPVLIAAIAALALAGAALGLLLSTVQAQEAEALVSNTDQDTRAEISFGTVYSAQGFATGSKAGGYVLSSIELDVERIPASPGGVTVELLSSMTMTDIDGNNPEEPEPNARLATLTHSNGTWTTGLNILNAPADTQLGPNTTYFVLVSDTELANSLRVHSTASSSADAGGASGWSVGKRFISSAAEPDHTEADRRLKFKVNGYELRNRPSEIRAYWRDDPENPNGSNEQVDCASTERFRAYWNPPKSNGSFKRADEWEAQITPKYGATNVSSTIQNTGGNPKEPELTGTVRIRDGEFGSVSIRVRGRFGNAWGAWSPVTELFCLPLPTCPENAGDVWCGVITVEESGGFYGFNSFNNSGELSDDDFDVGASSYTINTLSVQGDTGAEDYGNLTFDLAESPDDAEQAALDGLTLHLDNDAFKLSDSRPGPAGFYYWVASLDWSREDYIVARLQGIGGM